MLIPREKDLDDLTETKLYVGDAWEIQQGQQVIPFTLATNIDDAVALLNREALVDLKHHIETLLQQE